MRPRVAALPVALALLLTACGAGGDAEPAAAPTSTPETTSAAPVPTPETTSAAPVPTTEPTSTPSPPAPVPEPEPTSPPPPPPPAAPSDVAVTIADFDYAPDPVEVAVGGTVTWTNQDSTAHTATISGGPNTGAISGGAAASLTFDAPGTYEYVCQFHPGSMTGTVVVR